MLLKQARETAGLSQAAAATRIGIDSVTLSRYERGKLAPPRPTLIALAQLYGKPIGLFVAGAASLGALPSGTSVTPGVGEVRATGHAPTVHIGSASETLRPSDVSSARLARNLPLAVRQYLAELRLRLTKGGASEDEIEEAFDLLRSPALFTFYKGGTPSELNEADVLRGMKALAEGVIIPELKDRGRKKIR